MMATIRKYGRYIAVLFLLNFLFSLFNPTVGFALTSGPASPEFTGFEPVTTTDMVNLFSGDLAYNLPVISIPGPDGAGYALSLSYHSGSGSETEASWVGHGWSLNPGSINRAVRGYPDDYNGENVQVYNKTKPNWTITMGASMPIEAWSNDLPINLSVTNRFNNYMGLSNSFDVGISANGAASIGMTFNGVDAQLTASINPMAMLMNHVKKHLEKKAEASYNEMIAAKTDKEFASALNDYAQVAAENKSASLMKKASTAYNAYSLNDNIPSIINNPYHGSRFSLRASLMTAMGPFIGPQIGLQGGFNMQVNEPELDRVAYGYLYTQPISNDNILEDFVVEKQEQYNKRSRNIGAPFNTADNFILSGEGLGGGFRAFRNDVGHYYPNTSESKSVGLSLGLEFGIGMSIQTGVGLGGGSGKLNINNSWDNNGNVSDYSYKDTRETIMRFTNDMGGKIDYTIGEPDPQGNVVDLDRAAESAILNKEASEPYIENDIKINQKEFKRSSSGISTHTEYDYTTSGKRFNKNVSQSLLINTAVPTKSIREISILKEDGSNYVYGIPAYVKDQMDFSVGITSGSVKHNNFRVIQDAHESSTENLMSNRTIVGTKKAAPYAATYLLTQITGANYFDTNNDGPDASDFGAWTKFEYRKKYGKNSPSNEWYRWRSPYSGLSYSKNSLSEPEDDMGSISTGEKEAYYMKSVETKTHIAFFITNNTKPGDFNYPGIPAAYLTGSGENRLDGLGAAEKSSNNYKAKDETQRLEKLEKIVLFSKNRLYKPLKIVHFKYNYDLIKNTPNNINSDWPDNPTEENRLNSGRLTLERVWFEYEGVSNARISPYEFYYQYYNPYPSEVLSEYGQLSEYNYLSEEAQNPDYEPELLDPWGNIQYDAINRTRDFKPGLYQGKMATNTQFDPAAWQLKRIKLPSGGEIHIQYEQKDYHYVQDRKAMSMVSLVSGSNAHTGNLELNLEDIGLIPENYSDYADYVKDIDALEAFLIKLKNDAGKDYSKLYFKFLYALSSGNTGSLTGRISDFISGYSTLKNVEKIAPGVANGRYRIRIQIGDDNEKDYPKNFAEAYILNHNKAVRDKIAATFEPLDNNIADQFLDRTSAPSNWGEAWAVIKGFLWTIGSGGAFFTMATTQMTFDGIVPGNIDLANSYVKIPNPRAKKGGGLRVKRLLMFDPGMQGINKDQMVYGNEYYYQTEDGKSSGVATNEPIQLREENALIGYLSRDQREGLALAFFGRDRSTEEGPIGENVLPGPSVGHSRVVVENIHKGKTGTGHVIHEYYTAKDYPFDKLYTTDDITGQGFDETPLKYDTENIVIPTGLFNYTKKYYYATQGFRFIINNMHGLQKRVSSWGGKYGDSNCYETAFEEYEYYQPGEKVPMLDFTPDGYKIKKCNPGKEMDISMHLSSSKDFNWDVNIEVDLGVILPLAPAIGLGFSINIDQRAIFTHAMSKVISYPVILKSTRSMNEGIEHVVENVYFDKFTGQPVVTKSYDEYNGLELNGSEVTHKGEYYSTDLKASWFYPEMGPSWSEYAENPTNQLTQSVGNIVTYQEEPFKNNSLAFKNVISANIQTLHESDADLFVDVEQGVYPLHKWLPWSAYTYKNKNTYKQGDGYNYTFESGWNSSDVSNIELAFANNTGNGFKWNAGTQLSPWLQSTTIEKFNTSGLPLVERNAMGIYSCAKYGYSGQLPILVAQNAKYNSVYFYDFELSSDYPSDLTFVPGIAHSGYQSIKLTDGEDLTLSRLNVDLSGETDRDYIIKFWLKTNPLVNHEGTIFVSGTPTKKVAQVGEWSLWECAIAKENVTTELAIEFTLGESVWLDDLKIQPRDAGMKTFVYDNATFRLLSEFDDQHFGLYYQYNDEGKLVRKIIETERGMYTVQEMQYNQHKVNR